MSKPKIPDLVGASVAAKILGIPGPHISRLRRRGRLRGVVPIEGTSDAYVKADVQALARELELERAERAVKS